MPLHSRAGFRLIGLKPKHITWRSVKIHLLVWAPPTALFLRRACSLRNPKTTTMAFYWREVQRKLCGVVLNPYGRLSGGAAWSTPLHATLSLGPLERSGSPPFLCDECMCLMYPVSCSQGWLPGLGPLQQLGHSSSAILSSQKTPCTAGPQHPRQSASRCVP
mgnify:CR=1 FL=1